MIKPINISPINTTNTLEFSCEKCGNFGTITLTNAIINIDKDGDPIESLDVYSCYKCGEKLRE